MRKLNAIAALAVAALFCFPAGSFAQDKKDKDKDKQETAVDRTAVRFLGLRYSWGDVYGRPISQPANVSAAALHLIRT